MIYFKYTTDEYGCLSNFSNHPITVDGKVWGTTEAWYQAQKFLSEAIKEEIRAKPTPKAAKVLAYTYRDQVRKDWQQHSIKTMEQALRYKVDQHESVRKKLLESKNQTLVERSDMDAFWGDGKLGDGRNELGKAWMRIRTELVKKMAIDPKTILEAEFADAGRKVIEEVYREKRTK